MAKLASPKIYDPYLGQMYGNVLDKYDNPTYNFRLYIQPRSVTPDKHKPDSKNIVILAQTGVTGTQIDNVEIKFTENKSGTTGGTTECRFTIKQPGAANFIDQIMYARKYVGEDDKQLMAQDFILWLDIKFLGYDTDPDNNEEGGEPTQIGDTITYALRLSTFSVKVDQTGSEYNFVTTYENAVGYSDEIYKIPANFSIIGSTITEFFKDLESQYNTYLEKNSDQYERPDKIAFNLGELVGAGAGSPVAQKTGSTGGTATSGSSAASSSAAAARADTPAAGSSSSGSSQTSASANTSSSAKAASGSNNKKLSNEVCANPEQNKEVEATTREKIPLANAGTDGLLAAGDDTKAGKRQEKTSPKFIIPLTKDDSIHKIAVTICGHNEEFQSLVSRKKTLTDPTNVEVDNERTFIYWLGVHVQVENTEWDKKRNRYTRKYTYTPYLSGDARSDIALTTKETQWLTEKLSESDTNSPSPTALATKRLQDLYNAGILHKSYFYIFTGLNDQIINLDINLDNAQSLLIPPKGGMIGEYAIVNSPAVSAAEPKTKDLTLGNQIEAAAKENKKESLIGLFKKLKGSVGDLKSFADKVGRSVEEINAAITDTTGASAKRLANALDSRTINSALSNVSVRASDDTNSPTSIAQVEVESIGPYKPEVSGYIYAADIVQPGTVTAEEMEKAGLTKGESTPANVGPAQPVTIPLASPLQGMTANGPASMLMGYVYRSRETTNFLLTVDLTIRGDPYWLTKVFGGPFNSDKPTPDQTIQPAFSTSYFLLTIGSPSRYDFNLNDEDDNSGYWSDNRSSTTFSGLYYPLTWECRFSNGVFTVTIKAAKEVAVPLSWIRPVPPGQAGIDWTKLGINDEAYKTYQGAQTQYNPNTGSPTSSDVITPGKPGTGGVFAPVYNTAPTAGGQPTDLARRNLGIGTGQGGNVTEADIKKLGTFTSDPPKATGDLAKDNKALEAWAKANGFRADENKFMGNGSVDPDAHTQNGSHYDGRGSDWNLPGYGGDNLEASDPYAGYRVDEAAKKLRAAGYNVIWRQDGHFNHMHVEVPKGN